MLKYYKEINLYLQKLTGDKVLAKDLTQETYTKFLEIIKTADNISKSYLYQIAKNLVIDKVRRDKLLLQTSYEEDEHSVYAQSSIEDSFLNETRKEYLKECIKNLPPQQKKAFILYFYKEYSRKEISQILNISTNAVEKNINRAITKIKEQMKDY